MPFSPLYQYISELSSTARQLINAEEFEKLNSVLETRLASLKQLDEEINQYISNCADNEKDSIIASYHQYLEKLKRSDAEDFSIVTSERKKALKNTNQQSKASQAVSAYKTVNRF